MQRAWGLSSESDKQWLHYGDDMVDKAGVGGKINKSEMIVMKQTST